MRSEPMPHASLLLPPAGLFHPTLDNVLPVRLGWRMVHGACSVPPALVQPRRTVPSPSRPLNGPWHLPHSCHPHTPCTHALHPQLTGECGISGFGASTDPGNWLVQVYKCGTTPCNVGANLPTGACRGPLAQHMCCWPLACMGRAPAACPFSACADRLHLPALPHAAWDTGLPTCVNTTEGPSCTLNPVGPATWNGSYYTAKYSFYVPDAWDDRRTYYFWR